MSMFAKLQRRADEGRPVRVGLIGAGKKLAERFRPKHEARRDLKQGVQL